MNIPAAQESFGRLLETIVLLRSPEGCPWDRVQTPMTLRSTFTEETYELIHAIQEGDTAGMREELGDVLLNVCMIGEMKETEGVFTLASVLEEIRAKLVRRHPHVFGNASAATPEAVSAQWEAIKATEKAGKPAESLLHKTGRSLPPLERAQKIQVEAAKVGFDWSDAGGVLEKIREEIEEVKIEITTADVDKLEGEIGDLLFSVVNLARFEGVNASLALLRTVEKFKDRFGQIERGLAREGKVPAPEHWERMEELWNESKVGKTF